MLYHIAKVSTPLPSNLIATRSVYGREIAQTDLGYSANLPPVWSSTSFSFTYGVASTKTAASMITDATGPVTVTRLSGGTQNGISWNDTLKQWEYDGVIGDPGSGSWLMRASDGVNPSVDQTITGSIIEAGSGTATWSDLLPMMWNANMAESSSQFKQQILGGLANNYAEWQAIEAQASDPVTWTMLATPLWAGFYPIAVDEEKHYITIIPG